MTRVKFNVRGAWLVLSLDTLHGSPNTRVVLRVYFYCSLGSTVYVENLYYKVEVHCAVDGCP